LAILQASAAEKKEETVKLFLDTANLSEIREAASLGVISGITTNPVIIAREGTRDMKSQIVEIASILNGMIIAEVLSRDCQGMISQAKEIAGWHPNIAVKIPMTWEGLKAVSALSKSGVKTVVTIVFTASQALLAAQAGAAYVAPFIGRSNDICQDGFKLVADIIEIFKVQGISTQVIAASIKNPIEVIYAAKAGSQVITVPFVTLKKMATHPSTDIILDEFLKGWDGVRIV
jgi:transaldolase